MENMFYNCKSLISVDFSNINKIAINNMGFMLYECTSLISLNLSAFDFSSIINVL